VSTDYRYHCLGCGYPGFGVHFESCPRNPWPLTPADRVPMRDLGLIVLAVGGEIRIPGRLIEEWNASKWEIHSRQCGESGDVVVRLRERP
jgi:hypothetical protein